MSFEAIKNIGVVEAEAREAIALAKEKALKSIEQAEKTGKKSITETKARAEREIKKLIHESDQQAAALAMDLVSKTANRKATLRARAEGRLDATAQLIAERIVNS